MNMQIQETKKKEQRKKTKYFDLVKYVCEDEKNINRQVRTS